MDAKKNDILRYCAGGAFLLQALLQLPYLGNVIWLIIYALIGVSFFIKKPVLATVGGAAWVVMSAINFIGSLSYGAFAWCIERGAYWWPVEQILFLAAKILFVVFTIKRKKQLGIAAAGLYIIAYLGEILFLGYSLWIENLLDVACFAFAAFAYESTPVKGKPAAPKPNVVQTPNVAQTPPVLDKIQQLDKLYGLLEKGILTEEEFDTKKHQLLN